MFRTAIGPSEYYWGSNSQVLNNAILLIIGREEGGPVEFDDTALDQLHYILGVNGYAHSFVTGIGARSTLHPHHRPSASDGIAAPVPGLMSGGPNHNVSDDPALAENFTSSTPPALCYIDDQRSYASNEICINWNAPLVFVAGYFAGGQGNASVVPPHPDLPSRIGLGQNYPNPFNGMTTIPITLTRTMPVELRVVDILGRRVASMDLGMLPAGTYSAPWHSDNSHVSSGVYFYSLASDGKQISDVRSLILLR